MNWQTRQELVQRQYGTELPAVVQDITTAAIVWILLITDPHCLLRQAQLCRYHPSRSLRLLYRVKCNHLQREHTLTRMRTCQAMDILHLLILISTIITPIIHHLLI